MNFENVMRVLQINVEGLSASKSKYISRLASEENIDVILLQELHVSSDDDLFERGTIENYVLAGYVLHQFYGCATYVRDDLSDWQFVQSSSADDIYQVTIKVLSTIITNLYKPPRINWPTNVLHTYQHPAIYMGDFNSHHTTWAYDTSDTNGDDLYNWSLTHNLHLKFDAKDLATFRSARWNKDFNPDLCFVSMDEQFSPLFTKRFILVGFPHSQHRPVILEVGLSVPLINSIDKPRWNFKLADWTNFSRAMDANIRFVPAKSSNYSRFVKLVISTAKKFIPRGYRKKYIPGWSPECDELFQEFKRSGSQITAHKLIQSLDTKRQNDWIALMESVDFKHSSRKGWKLLQKLDFSNNKRSSPNLKCSVNAIASHLLRNTKVPMEKSVSDNVISQLNVKLSNCNSPEDPWNNEFTVDEISMAISYLKPRVSVGFDGIFNEFFINFGPKCKRWLAKFYSDVLFTGLVPSIFLKSKVCVFLKPGKSGDKPEDYRPISLLSASYKLLERLIYCRISDQIYSVIPTEQGGFRPERNCCDQVLSLVSFIEAGFQTKEKTGVAYIDLSAAFDTVWRKGLLLKLINVIPSTIFIKLLNQMLCNRRISVFLGGKSSRTRNLNDGLPQGSVLAPLLFILYISDLPSTKSNKFIYADDIALAYQDNKFENIEVNLSADLQVLWEYFKLWRLRPNISKTAVNFHHLTNCLSNRRPNVEVDNIYIQYIPSPRYLGVILDRSLTYKQHIDTLLKKLKTRVNIIHKLAGTSWGANSHTLRTSSLALVYSVAEYCAPVWLNSHHAQKVDVELNKCMRIITGCVNSTPLPWLHVLSNIAPPVIRRQYAAANTWRKIKDHPELLCHRIISNQPVCRLPSRVPSYQSATPFFEDCVFLLDRAWEEYWSLSDVQNSELIVNINSVQPGFDMRRRLWVTLNRIRTGHGRCGSCLFKWGLVTSAACDCGNLEQTMKHIVNECAIRAFSGGMEQLLTLSSDAISWLENLDIIL